MRLYEGDVELKKWADGPVQLIMLGDEKDVWEDLESDEQRRSFVDWFWARRDNDLRDAVNPVMMAFYTRVGEANGRFTGIPRGWKTDRGRVWSVLGGPDRARTGTEDEDETWNYWAPGLEPVLGHSAQAGELNIYFARRDLRTYRIAGGVGPGVWPPYVLRVLEFVNQAMIASPDLEFSPGSD
jgi:GWxTD domain-containing protein